MAAKNTYKSNTPKKNRTQGKKIKFGFGFFRDRRFQLSLGFFLFATSVFLLTAFISFIFTGQADQSVVEAIQSTGIKDSGLEAENWLGVVGAISAHYFIFHWFGISAFFLPPLLFIFGFKLVSKRDILPAYKSFKFVLFFTFWLCLLFGYTAIKSEPSHGLDILSGGIGHELALIFHALIGWGTYLFLILSLLVFVVYFFNITELISFDKFQWKTSGSKDQQEQDIDIETEALYHDTKEPELSSEELIKKEEYNNLELDSEHDEETKDLTLKLSDDFENAQQDYGSNPSKQTMEGSEPDVELIVETSEGKEKAIDKLENYDPTLDLGTYQYPTLDLLNDYDTKGGQVTKEELEQNKDKIVETLINFKIGISSIKATIGPTVTLYEIVPDAGVKISKIKNLEDDIALSLAALGIRIIAPIPGKGTIGIEVPNKNKTLVTAKKCDSD